MVSVLFRLAISDSGFTWSHNEGVFIFSFKDWSIYSKYLHSNVEVLKEGEELTASNNIQVWVSHHLNQIHT